MLFQSCLTCLGLQIEHSSGIMLMFESAKQNLEENTTQGLNSSSMMVIETFQFFVQSRSIPAFCFHAKIKGCTAECLTCMSLFMLSP